ncbi:MAG: Crp/Fnr family transcriptional regulator [Actinobacteria bacterium]|nr:MAG: Crp/Fnr family transcriptional regulator [Actinomycetota bacterium]
MASPAPSPEPQRGFWATLSKTECDALIEAGVRSTFAPGSVLLAHHDSSGDVAIVWSGLIKAAVRVADDKHVVLALRGPGDIVGELAHINGGRRSAAVIAVNRVEALIVPRDRFTELLGRDRAAADSLRRIIVDRLCEADRDRLAAASMTVGQRLARYLLKLVWRHGVPVPDGSLRIDQLSQEDLAACIGGGPRTVAREMGEWRKRSIISTERRSVIVHEPAALDRIAGRHAPPP